MFTLIPGMLDHIMVDAYGSKAPLSSLGKVTMKSKQLFFINVFDSAVHSIKYKFVPHNFPSSPQVLLVLSGIVALT